MVRSIAEIECLKCTKLPKVPKIKVANHFYYLDRISIPNQNGGQTWKLNAYTTEPPDT